MSQIKYMENKEKKYWRSLGQLKDSPEYRKQLLEEYKTEKSSDPSQFSRRSFLTIMGASMALAGLAGCRRPAEKIVPYVKPYGREIFQLLNHPEGQALLRLAAILGESVIDYTLQYPDDFPRALFKYGRISITAIKQYNDEIIAFARQYSDDALYYAGRYGEHILRLLKSGRAGITLLRVLPETKLQDARQFKYLTSCFIFF